MSSATQPLPPARRVGSLAALRRGAAWLHLGLALAIALGVFVQVYLIGAYVGLSLLMALLGTTQIALADAHGWTGGLHPLGALLVLVLATAIVRRDLRRRRARDPW